MARIWNSYGDRTPELDWLSLAQSSSYKAQVLARLCHISPRQLRRCFNKHFGRSTQAWLDEQRMRAAAPLLKQLGSVKRVAYELGFKQVSHFSRAFKSFYGVTASQFAQGFLPDFHRDEKCHEKCPRQITFVG